MGEVDEPWKVPVGQKARPLLVLHGLEHLVPHGDAGVPVAHVGEEPGED